MRRREFLSAGVIGIGSVISGAWKPARADADNPTNAEIIRDTEEWRARAIAAFPYQRLEVPGEQAYAMWLQLRAEQRGSPVVLGDDDDVAFLMERFAVPGTDESYLTAAELKASVESRLKRARDIRHPRDLLLRRLERNEHMKQWLLQNSPPGSEEIVDFLAGKTIEYPESLTDSALLMAVSSGAREGTWPEEPPQATSDEQGLTVARLDSRTPVKRAHIAVFPTDDWTEIPAYLDWGGKTRPACEYHVAALRSWRDRYGAELVGLDLEEMNVRVSRPPATREEALLLAREQYCYSAAIVEFGGIGSLSELASILKNDPWWLFWWR